VNSFTLQPLDAFQSVGNIRHNAIPRNRGVFKPRSNNGKIYNNNNNNNNNYSVVACGTMIKGGSLWILFLIMSLNFPIGLTVSPALQL
jgi:hypothetical protein